MAFNLELAQRIRSFLEKTGSPDIEEKKMFGGLAFMINGHMCVCVSKDRMMCRFDPDMQKVFSAIEGFEEMVMKGRNMNGFGFIPYSSIEDDRSLHKWINVCLDYNKTLPPKRKK